MGKTAFRTQILLPAKAKVTLVADGAGDPELLTLQAEKAMVAPDVLLVDDLVNPEILQ